MPEYFYIVFTLYYIFVLLMWYGWGRLKNLQEQVEGLRGLSVSVVIAVRNEEKNIPFLIEDLAAQSLPGHEFEVIIVDDRSEDDTVAVAKKSLISHENLNGRVIENRERKNTAPKKAALLAGIDAAKGGIIAMTDGDCRMGREWLETMRAPFGHDSVLFVSGPVVIHEKKGIFSWVQSLEFASLMGSGAALIALGYPLMCNGANLAFRKKAFSGVGGYEDVAHHATGDDVYLMQKIHRKHPGSVHFVKDQRAVVATNPAASASGFIAQRRRWASKWNRHLLNASWALPVFLFVFYLSFVAALLLPFFHENLIIPIANVIIVKMALDYFFLREVMAFSGLRMKIWLFFMTELLYPFYVLYFGLVAHTGGWTWKGREFKT